MDISQTAIFTHWLFSHVLKLKNGQNRLTTWLFSQ